MVKPPCSGRLSLAHCRSPAKARVNGFRQDIDRSLRPPMPSPIADLPTRQFFLRFFLVGRR